MILITTHHLSPPRPTFILAFSLLLRLSLSGKRRRDLSEQRGHIEVALRGCLNEQNVQFLRERLAFVRGDLSGVRKIGFVPDKNDHHIIASLDTDVAQPFTSILKGGTI